MSVNRFRRPVLAAALWLGALAFAVTGCGSDHHMLSNATAPSGAGSDAATAGEVSDDASVRIADAFADDEQEAHSGPVRTISGPTTITEPGRYRLASDLVVAAGDGIVIRASGVKLWLGDHTLTGPGNKAGRAIVIDGAHDVMVRGGHIVRFGLGVAVLDSRQCRVRGVAIDGGDETADPANGNPPQIGIMLVNSAYDVLAGNRMRGVNLGMFVRGAGSTGNLLRENDVVGGANGLLGVCYNPAPTGGDTGPHADRVVANSFARFGKGISASPGSANNLFAANAIRYYDAPWSDLNGSNVFRRNREIQIAR